jgi:hypothetical protein
MESRLERESRARGVSKSELVRISIQNYLSSLTKPSAYQLGQDVFGKFSSGKTDTSVNRRTTLSEKIRNKKTK